MIGGTFRTLLLLAAAVQLGGCAAMSGYPHPVMDQREEEAELAPYLKASAVANYETCADKVACRNMIVDARVRAVDLAFYRFQRRLLSQEGGVSLGTDILTMGLDSAAAITGTKALAAGAGLLTGSRDAYEKQVLRASMPLLFEEMVSKRREVLVRIRQGEMLPVGSYSLFQALNDISEYELAGSLFSAAAELQANAGSSASAAQAKLDALRAVNVPAGAVAASAPASSGAPAASAVPLPTATMPPPTATMPTAAMPPPSY